MVQAVYGILQFFHILPAFGQLPVTGSFDNPAGFASALCAGLPFALSLLHNRHKWVRYFTTTATPVIMAAVFLSHSRTGMISVGVIVFLWLLPILRRTPALKWTLSVLLPALLVTMYLLKKDSADGRLLIWRCSLAMVADKPIFGYGPGGFTAHYMEYQADYFREHPDSPFARLADTVHHPFNEYLLVAVDYGFFGLLVLAALGYVTLRQYRKQNNRDPAVRAAGLSLISIGVFALFSYPFLYPFTWVMTLFSLWIIVGRPWPACTALRIGAVVAAATVCVFTVRNMRYQLYWCKADKMALEENNEDALLQYERLSDYFADNRFFLYNYAVNLSKIGQYEKSLAVAERCSRLWADYYLQIILGDDCLKLGRHRFAETYFSNAAAMCPVRFIPWYKLVTVYQAMGRTDDARALAQLILDKTIKVPSPVVYAIRREMRQLIDSLTIKYPENETEDNF